MQYITDHPYKSDAVQLFPKGGAVHAKLLKLSLTGNQKDKTGDENETWRYEAIDIIEYAVPRCVFVSRYDKSVENVNLDHDNRRPAAEEVNEDETVLHHRSLLVGRH